MSGRAKNEADFKRVLGKHFAEVVPEGMALTIDPGPAQQRGLPDRLFLHAGMSAWVEAKVGSYKPDARQITMMTRLASAGARVWVAHCNWNNEAVTLYSAPDFVTPRKVCLLEQTKYRSFWDDLFHGILAKESAPC